MTIGMLSWGSPLTLENTLRSYWERRLDSLDTDRIIFFQEISDRDRAVAREYGYRAIGSNENIGIARAMIELINQASGDLFLFLENDWELIEYPHDQLIIGTNLLMQHVIDVARFRHRVRPGDPLWTRQFYGREYEKPEHLLDAAYNRESLVDFKEFWNPYVTLDNERYKTDWVASYAEHANWTNNPIMFRTSWFKGNIMPRIAGDIERDLQPWWRGQNYIVAQSTPGLFMHNRLDR